MQARKLSAKRPRGSVDTVSSSVEARSGGSAAGPDLVKPTASTRPSSPPLAVESTPTEFQLRVYSATKQVPPGSHRVPRTRILIMKRFCRRTSPLFAVILSTFFPGRVTTYAKLAAALSCGSAIAVGQALKRNPYAPVSGATSVTHASY